MIKSRSYIKLNCIYLIFIFLNFGCSNPKRNNTILLQSISSLKAKHNDNLLEKNMSLEKLQTNLNKHIELKNIAKKHISISRM